MKAVVAAFNQEKALVGAFSVITNLRMELFEALLLVTCPRTLPIYCSLSRSGGGGAQLPHHPAQWLREHRLRVHWQAAGHNRSIIYWNNIQYYLLHDCRLLPGSWTWRRAGSGTARSSPWPGSRRPRRQKLSHNIVLLILATLHNQDIMYNVLYIQCNTFALIASCPAHAPTLDAGAWKKLNIKYLQLFSVLRGNK